MKNLYALLATTLLTACTAPHSTYNSINNSTEEVAVMGGVEIARTQLTGPSGGLTTSGQREDCAGPGLGVQVEGTTKSQAFLFDSTGNPCDAAEEIFNGRDKIHQRPLDATNIQIGFQDALGPIAPQVSGTPLKPIIMNAQLSTESSLPEDYATAPQGTAPRLNILATEDIDFPEDRQSAGSLESTITQWQTDAERKRMEQERAEIMGKSAATLSSMRELDRLTSRELIQSQHDKMLELMARLREAEKQLELEQQRHQQTLTAVDTTRNVAEAKITNWQQKEAQLAAEKATLQGRLAAFESLSQRIAREKQEQEAALTNRVQTLEEKLRQAENEASTVRKELVLEAAQKIAEAERITYAARLAEKQAKSFEAQRLKAEGEEMLTRANALSAGKNVVVPRMADMFDTLAVEGSRTPRASLMPLEDVPIMVNVKDKPLNTIVADIFTEVQKSAGNWQVDWQLSGKSQYILQETWTLTAEARFDDIMAHIQKTVAEQNNIILSFRRFEGSKLFVISDE